MQLRRTAGIIPVVLLVAAGCQAADFSPSASSTAGATTVPSVAPATPIELTTTPDPLPAGVYTRSSFSPAVTFELDGPWHAVQLLEGFFDVQQDVGSPDVIAVQFGRPEAVYAAAAEPVDVASAQAAADALAEHPGLTVIGESPSQVGGLDGLTVEVENAGESHVQVMDVPPGPLGIDPGRRLWVSFFDTPDGLLAIMVGGSVATWDDALLTAEPVLESIRISP